MNYKWIYITPKNFSNIVLISDGKYLTGLYFEDAKECLVDNYEEKNLKIFKETSKWLDRYFNGEEPKFYPKYKIINLTPFKEEVYEVLKTISYGEVLTYSDIAKILAKKRNIARMSSQAVGHALNKNPLCIILPCHRVVGKNKQLVGYTGGIKNKLALLELEANDKK